MPLDSGSSIPLQNAASGIGSRYVSMFIVGHESDDFDRLFWRGRYDHVYDSIGSSPKFRPDQDLMMIMDQVL